MKKLLLLIIPIVLLVLACNSPFGNNTNRLKYTAAVGSGQNSAESSIKLFYRTLRINIDGDGYVLVNDKEYDTEIKLPKDSIVRIEAIANVGQEFFGFSGSVKTDKPVLEVVMDKDIVLTASFVVPTVYKKLFLTIGKGGAVKIDGVLYENNTDKSKNVVMVYEEGSKVKLEAIANNPDVAPFEGWISDVIIKDASIEITLDDNITLVASFDIRKKVFITNSDFSKITVKINNISPTELIEALAKNIEVEVEVGDVVEITPTATNTRTHYFAGWSGSITSSDPIIITTISDSLTLTLHYAQVMKTLTINTIQGKATSYKIDEFTKTTETLPIDSIVKIEAVEKYYPFKNWSTNDIHGVSHVVSSERLYATFKLEEDTVINATFETGAFDVYDDPDLNGYNAYDFFHNYVLFSTKFDANEVPYYVFNKDKAWTGPTNQTVSKIAVPTYSYRSDVSPPATSGTTTANITKMDIFQYRGINYYYTQDFPHDTRYHTGEHLNRLKRFYFHRFTGTSAIVGLNNAMCAVDTYTKLVWGYAVPTKWGLFGNPTEWKSIESQDTTKGIEFYKYDPIGFVEKDGKVVLFETFINIQSNAAGKKKAINYYPKYTPTAPVELDITKLNNNSVIRSPYLE